MKAQGMIKVDFKRMLTQPLFYIISSVSFIMPILILVMTTMVGKGEEEAEIAFTNVWQAIGSASGSSMSMDIKGMCNINMLFFLIAIFSCIFVSDDFRSGFAKNIFTVRVDKTSYVFSKIISGFTIGVVMLTCFFVGSILGGKIAGLSFDTGSAGISGIIACMISKGFISLIFVSIAVLAGAVAKNKLWLSILISLGACMLLFTMVPMISPLDSGILNVVLAFVGGILAALGLGFAGNKVLSKTNIL